MIANKVAPIPGSSPMLRAIQPRQGWTPPLRGLFGHSALRPAGSRCANGLLSCIGQDRANESSLLADRSRMGRSQRMATIAGRYGESVWRENEVEAREVKRIPVRRRRQESDAQFRRVRKQTSF